MPTLELPNLAAYQTRTTTTPIARANAAVPIGPPVTSQTQCPPGCQPPGLNLCVAQGATLSSQIALTIKDANGVTKPLDITGNKFEFTAKTNLSLPDSDPSVVKINWVETTTPTAGTTWLVVPSNITAAMQLVPYFYQVWMVQSPTSPAPIVTPLFSGSLVVTQPVSSRNQ